MSWNPADSRTWPAVLYARDVARIYRRHPDTIRRKWREGTLPRMRVRPGEPLAMSSAQLRRHLST